MAKRKNLEFEAYKKGMSVKDYVTWALIQGGGTAYGAARVIGISHPSITAAMQQYGLHVDIQRVVTVTEREPA